MYGLGLYYAEREREKILHALASQQVAVTNLSRCGVAAAAEDERAYWSLEASHGLKSNLASSSSSMKSSSAKLAFATQHLWTQYMLTSESSPVTCCSMRCHRHSQTDNSMQTD